MSVSYFFELNNNILPLTGSGDVKAVLSSIGLQSSYYEP